MRQQQIRIALGLIFLIISLLVLLSGLYDIKNFSKHKFWWLSIIFSLLSVITACFSWYLSFSVPLSEYQQNKTVIDDAVYLNKFISFTSLAFKAAAGKKPIYVPTGIYIQSLEFSSSSNIQISGLIWQKYQNNLSGDITKGFIMSEAKNITITEAYRQKNQKEEVIGWHLEATIRKALNYTKYPFEHPDISIWLKSNDFTHNVILTPDLDGYRSLSAATLPGLQPCLALPGYYFGETIFSYELKMANTNFGITKDSQEVRAKELFYNIIIRRNLMTPLVSKFFPILIVISMLFVVILSFSTNMEKKQNFGLTGLAVVGLLFLFSLQHC
ncbi:MAG: hypothetical protein PHP17_07335 [Candidatus Omnitrophica bacterium]|nr:hypothetical protein [Candidatus Omnitrophota bacterium]